GVLASAYRDRGLTVTEEHPPLPPLAPEPLPGTPTPVPSVQLQLETTPLPARFWFMNEARTTLVQVQQDRFVQNWRRGRPDERYPRYRTLLPSFVEHFRAFADFVAAEKVGEIIPNACEVTYVNPLPRGHGWERPGE